MFGIGIFFTMSIFMGFMNGLMPAQETSWFHVPLCHNVQYSECSLPNQVPNDGVHFTDKDTSSGCCRTFDLDTTAYKGFKALTVASMFATFPKERLDSKWFGKSEFRSGAPEFFDYTGPRQIVLPHAPPHRAFNGQCASPPSESSNSLTNATGFTYKYKIPINTLDATKYAKFMIPGSFYMPKVLHTEGLKILSLIITVNAGSKGTKTYDLSPVPGEVTAAFPYKCDGTAGPIKTFKVDGSSTTAKRRLDDDEEEEEEELAHAPMKRRRTLLKGGSSSGSSGGYELSSRSRNYANSIYMPTSGRYARSRTNYGYSSRKHVAAEFSGEAISSILFPDNSQTLLSTNGMSRKTITVDKKLTDFYAESAILLNRHTYMGSTTTFLTLTCNCPPTFLKDGACDTSCNNEACNWDDGDCTIAQRPKKKVVTATATTGISKLNLASLYYQDYDYLIASKVRIFLIDTTVLVPGN